MALFGKKKKDFGPVVEPIDPKWAKSGDGRYPHFFDLDPAAARLDGASGVYIIWHGGIQPGWVYIGWSDDIGGDFRELAENREVDFYERRGRLFCSWCFIRKDYQKSVVAFLTKALKPKVDNPDALALGTDELIPVVPPGLSAEQKKALSSRLAVRRTPWSDPNPGGAAG